MVGEGSKLGGQQARGSTSSGANKFGGQQVRGEVRKKCHVKDEEGEVRFQLVEFGRIRRWARQCIPKPV